MKLLATTAALVLALGTANATYAHSGNSTTSSSSSSSSNGSSIISDLLKLLSGLTTKKGNTSSGTASQGSTTTTTGSSSGSTNNTGTTGSTTTDTTSSSTGSTGTDPGTIADVVVVPDVSASVVDTSTIISMPVVSAVPEPETYAMLLAGLGLIGVVARRKKRA